MRYEQIRTIEDALLYFIDCNLATIEDMACKKSRPKGEYKRQIEIAQKMIYQLIAFDIAIDKGNRADKIIREYKGDVTLWAKSMEDDI